MNPNTIVNWLASVCYGVAGGCAVSLTGIYIVDGWNDFCGRVAVIGFITLAFTFVVTLAQIEDDDETPEDTDGTESDS